jgi:hypothetical protein
LGGSLTATFSLAVLRSGLGLGALLMLCVAALYAAADVLSRSRAEQARVVRRRSGALSPAAVAVAMSVLLAVAAIAVRDTLSPLGSAVEAAATMTVRIGA